MYGLAYIILLVIIAHQIRTIYLSYKAPNIIPEELPALKKDGKGKIEVIDIRSVGRFNRGRIKGAKHVAYGHALEYTLGQRKDRRYVFVSQNGSQTGRIIKSLLEEGYDVYNLKGGFRAWKKYQGD